MGEEEEEEAGEQCWVSVQEQPCGDGKGMEEFGSSSQ